MVGGTGRLCSVGADGGMGRWLWLHQRDWGDTGSSPLLHAAARELLCEGLRAESWGAGGCSRACQNQTSLSFFILFYPASLSRSGAPLKLMTSKFGVSNCHFRGFALSLYNSQVPEVTETRGGEIYGVLTFSRVAVGTGYCLLCLPVTPDQFFFW